MMIGNDLVRVSRMKSVCNNQHVFDRIFTPDEKVYITNATNPKLRLERTAGKIAIKEAVAKAFGVGIGKELCWLDVQTTHNLEGKPIIQKTDKICALLSKHHLENIDVSVSHMGDYATAVCLIF